MLVQLPTELLLSIAPYLSNRDLNALAQTSTHMFRLYDDYLYRRDAVKGSALLWAAKCNQIQTAKKALAAGTTVACPGTAKRGNPGENPAPCSAPLRGRRQLDSLPCWILSEAAACSSDEIVELLLDMPSVDVNHLDVGGGTPIFDAILLGSISTLKLFLSSDRVDGNARNNSGHTPLILAVINASAVEKARVLIGCDRVDPDIACNAERTPLSYAAAFGDVDTAELLLRTGRVELNRKDDTGRTPLAWAAENCQSGTIKLLLETEGVDPNIRDYPGGWTPLNLAIVSNWDESGNAAIGLLVNHEAVDLNAKTENITPLMYAALHDRRAQVEQLMDSGRVDPNAIGCEGLTALHVAAGREPAEIVEVLLRYDAVDCNIKCSIGFTPLAVAAHYGNTAAVTMLLQSGRVADLNERCGDSGRTSLWWAAARNHGAAVDAFLSHGGVDINLEDDFGKTPLSIAREKGHKKVASVLRRYMDRDRHVYPLPTKPWTFEDVEVEEEGVLGVFFSLETE